jgi:hypothetical protein
MKWLSLPLLLFVTTSCWRMPQEDDVSVLPQTNNPTLTNQGPNAPWMPGVNY